MLDYYVPESFYVRYFIREYGELTHLDLGPLDHYLAELLIADVGVDGTVQHGLMRVAVERAVIIDAAIADP